MRLTALAKNASHDDAQPVLFGLLIDGSGETRFTGLNGAPSGDRRASSERSRFSPSSDWYGRWAVRPLHGTLVPRAARMERGVCPEDIVVLRPRRHA